MGLDSSPAVTPGKLQVHPLIMSGFKKGDRIDSDDHERA
jgi:hypothetical protein